jgi:hypothetical protein
MSEISFQDYAAMQELQHQRTRGWGSTTALWVIAAVIVIAFFVYSWSRSCNEKVQFATGLANVTGRISALEPAVVAQGNNLYALNGVTAATVQGVGDLKQNALEQIYALNNQVFYHPPVIVNGNANNGRKFEQTSNYTLSSQNVAVTESCGGSGCNCG